ncbi:MAG: GH92 family glycosyl hydrolase, partial [Bacteroidales bacterium]|nr:GH92 family glycosyl hydrolase [Bacteroidales bacterium]
VKPGPDTEMRRNYLDAKYITGFSQLHISGTGGNAQSGTIGILPTTGDLKIDPKEYRSTFDPNSGVADVDFYSMLLSDYNVRVELTSTERVAFYRFIFPSSEKSHILINISHAFNKFRGGEVNIVNETSLEGTGKYNGYHGSDFDIAYYIELDRASTSSGVWKESLIQAGGTQASIEGDKELGAYLDFETSDNDTIMMKVAISYVDIDGAKNNMSRELPDWDFERVRNDSKKIWEDLLGQVKLEGGTNDQNTTFYTALYHTMLSPATLSDIDGRYEGFDGEIHVAKDFTYYGEFSLWDTYRTVHPLYAILQPQRQNDMVKSLLTIAEQGGWLPKWSWSEGYTGGMLGDHAVSVIVDSYMKGIRDFDEEFAWRAIRKNAMEKI